MRFLSIIVPIYNMERYLAECLVSLKKQHFDDDVEILLLDDGSTDHSGKICDDIAERDSHFKVFHQKNVGVAATRNRGLYEATGRYIAWVDPDDYITNDWWRVVQPVLLKNPDLVYFDMKMLRNGKFTEIHYDRKSRVIEPNEWYNELANGNRIMSHLWSKIFRRTLFAQEKIFNEKFSFCEDYQALHQITFPIQKCIYLHDCLYVYRQRDSSIVHDEKNRLINAWKLVELNQQRYNFYHDKGVIVSSFGILYVQFLFCLLYCSMALHQTMSSEWKERYLESIAKLHQFEAYLLQSPNLNIKLKICLVLLLHHLYFVIEILKKVKDIIGEK